MKYPRYFENIITGNVYKFESVDTARLYSAKDSVTRLSCDFALKKVTPHTDNSIWMAMSIDEKIHNKETKIEIGKMTIDQIKEAKEELEHDIQRRIMIFEKDTKVKVSAVYLKIFETSVMGGSEVLRHIEANMEVRI